MTYYYILFAFFAVVIYMMVVDENVGIAIDLLFKYFVVQCKRLWWMARFHPRNPISKWVYERRLNKMISDLQKELGVEDDTLR
jgi:hypothetical protein